MNNILNKIAQMERNAEQVNLASHKVELALFDDIKSSIDGARKMKEEIISNFAKANGGMRFCDAFDKSFSKAEQMAKEVGFDIPQDVFKLKNMNDELRSFFTKVKSLD